MAEVATITVLDKDGVAREVPTILSLEQLIAAGIIVVGNAAEDAAAAGSPVLIGGRYDSSARDLDPGDAGAIALNVNGFVKVDLSASSGAIDISDDYTRQIGKVKIVNDSGTVINPATASTPKYFLDVDESEDEVVAAAATLYWVHVVNLANAKRYLKFYNATAANVTVGTTAPVLTFPIPTMGDTNGAGFTINFGPAGVAFSTAMTIAATTGFADNDTGAPGANEIIVNLGYV